MKPLVSSDRILSERWRPIIALHPMDMTDRPCNRSTDRARSIWIGVHKITTFSREINHPILKSEVTKVMISWPLIGLKMLPNAVALNFSSMQWMGKGTFYVWL